MPTDARALLRPLLPPGRRGADTVVELMASAYNEPGIANSLATSLDAILSARRISVIGLATFVPELASPYRAMYRKAQDALLFLIRLARALRTKRHPAHNIEIVGGSLIGGVECRGSLSKPLLLAKQVPPVAAMRGLFSHLEVVAAAASSAKVSLSLELEPGPLFIVHSWRDLRRAYTHLMKSAHMRRVLGYNLDKAHWAMSGIRPEDVLSGGPLRGRVVHAHIADHGRGHLGDVGIGVWNDPREVSAWVRAMNEIAAKAGAGRTPRATKRISIELEAVSHVGTVALSSERMGWIVQKVAGGGPEPMTWQPAC